MKLSEQSLAELCPELGRIETLSDNRAGGPSTEDIAAIRRLEAGIGNRRADSLSVLLWRAKRLARATTNEWRADITVPLARVLERDIKAFER